MGSWPVVLTFLLQKLAGKSKPFCRAACLFLQADQRRLNLQLFAEDGDKTEEPTPHRRREARRRGQVMKSMELNAAVNMLGMVFFFVLFWRYFRGGLLTMFYDCFSQLPGSARHTFSFAYLARYTLEHYLAFSAPFLLMALFLGFFSNLLQVGFLVSVESIRPQASRINPLEGFKRIFSRRALFELIKSLLKVVIVGAVSYLYLRVHLPDLILLLGREAGGIAAAFGRVLQGLALRVALVFLFLALLDFLYQRYEFQKQLRMTRKEVKDEFKQLEGDPHVRSRQRERQRSIARRRSLADVPAATVVITNPTEYAVALRYKEKEDHAPVLVAKGVAVLARRIRELAEEHDIPVIQNPPVARLLYEQVEIGEEIPEDLYQAVAEILALVYRLQEKERRRHRSGI